MILRRSPAQALAFSTAVHSEAGQPFFAQVQLRGGKLRDILWCYDEVVAGLTDLVTADEVTLPPYYPDHPLFRKDWAEYLNSVQYTDKEVGLILARLDEEGFVAAARELRQLRE